MPDSATLTLALYRMLLNQTLLEFVADGRTLDHFYRDDGGPGTYTAVSGVLYQGTKTLTSSRLIPVTEPSSTRASGPRADRPLLDAAAPGQLTESRELPHNQRLSQAST